MSGQVQTYPGPNDWEVKKLENGDFEIVIK